MSSQRLLTPIVRLAALAAVAAGGAARSLADEPAVSWRGDYASALAESQSSGRPLWIQFTGSWCPNCARMERDSFPSPTVAARANSEFVPVKLQADANQEMAVDLGLTGIPASVIVAPDRNVLAVHQGYLGPEELDGMLATAAAAVAPRPEPRTEEAREAELAGFCPVSLVVDRELVAGRAEFAAEYDGRVYRLASAEALESFRGDPERFVPANDGRCPVERLDAHRDTPGDPRLGALYKDHLYLCASKADRARFMAHPRRYAAVGVEDGGGCPHCLAERGETVPGDPRFSLTLDGRRYWFPDEGHRGAFLSLAPSDTIRR